MTNDNQDALDVAEAVQCFEGCQCPKNEAAAHLRRLVRENEEKEAALKIVEATCDDFANQIEAKDALLRQAVEALDAAGKYVPDHQVLAAIRQHLEGRHA